MTEIFGPFVEQTGEMEFLVMNFSPNSLSIQERWRNNGLSADFLADYWGTFFPADDPLSVKRREEIKAGVAYIANELLENAMKFSHPGAQCSIGLGLYLKDHSLRFYGSNAVSPDRMERFKGLIQELLVGDPQEMFLEQMEKNAADESGRVSNLGYLTILNDYDTSVAWRFSPLEEDPAITMVTTMIEMRV